MAKRVIQTAHSGARPPRVKRRKVTTPWKQPLTVDCGKETMQAANQGQKLVRVRKGAPMVQRRAMGFTDPKPPKDMPKDADGSYGCGGKDTAWMCVGPDLAEARAVAREERTERMRAAITGPEDTIDFGDGDK